MMSKVQNRPTVNKITGLPRAISPLPKIIFTDVDDTLTYNGVLPATTFAALHTLQNSGFTVVPVTGASAGWCDCLIKTWPIQHIIGENGALTLRKNAHGIVSSHFAKNSETVADNLGRLKRIGDELCKNYPEIQYTQDQNFRLTDIAFDIGQTVTIQDEIAEQATTWLRSQGVQAHRSSIHINVWMGDHSKASGAMSWLSQRNMSERDCLFIGDSPNDESMFEHFPLSVGVANIERFLCLMEHVPNYITKGEGGNGFVELANVLLKS